MDIDILKQWLDEAITFFSEVGGKEGKRRDIQPNIEENRKLFDAAFRKRGEIKAWVIANKPNALPYLIVLNGWLEDWFSYFKVGFKPEVETIDTLAPKILERLEFIRTKLDSL